MVATSSPTLLKRPMLTWWKRTKLHTKQFMLFWVGEIVLIGLLVGAGLAVSPAMRAIHRDRASAELQLLNASYHIKIDQISTVYGAHARNSRVLKALEQLTAGRTTTPRKPLLPDRNVKRLLSDELTSSKIELSVLLDPNGYLLEAGEQQAPRSSENQRRFVDPFLIASRAAKSGHQIVESHVISHSDFVSFLPPLWRERKSEFDPLASDHLVDTRDVGLIRYVATPCIVSTNGTVGAPNGTSGDRGVVTGVLLAGDLVNGKVSIVAEPTEALEGGYSAVWHSRTDPGSLDGSTTAPPSFVQASSYIGFPQGGSTAMLAGRSFAEHDLLRRAWEANGTTVTERLVVAGEQLTVAAARESPGSPVVLVRGTTERHEEVLENTRRDTLILVSIACLLVDCLMQVLTLRSFTSPLETIALQLKMKRTDHAVIDKLLRSIPSARTFALRAIFPNLVILVVVLFSMLSFDDAVRQAMAQQATNGVRVLSSFYWRKPRKLRALMRDDARDPSITQVVADWDDAYARIAQQGSRSPTPWFHTNDDDDGARSLSFPTTSCSNSTQELGECIQSNSSSSQVLPANLSKFSSGPSLATRSSLRKVKSLLSAALEEQSIEIALLLDKQQRIIVSGNSDYEDFRRGQRFNPNGIVSKILSSPAEIVTTGVLSYEEYARVDAPLHLEGFAFRGGKIVSGLSPSATLSSAIIRWVAVPVFTANTTEAARASCSVETHADAVLLYGDIVNGKLGVLGGAANILQSGYSGVYLHRPSSHAFSLATSLLVDQKGVGAESDVGLPSHQLLHDAASQTSTQKALKKPLQRGTAKPRSVSSGELRITGHKLPSERFKITVQAVPRGFIVDSYGEQRLDESPVAYLVRGTPFTVSVTLEQLQGELYAFIIIGLVFALILRGSLAYVSYAPARQLARTLRSLGFLKKRRKPRREQRVDNWVGNNGNNPARAQSESRASSVRRRWRDLTSSSPLSGVRFQWRLRSRREKLLIMMALLSSVTLSAAVLVSQFRPPPSVESVSTSVRTNTLSMEEVSALVELTLGASMFLHETQKERGSTALMVGSGWLSAQRRYSTFTPEVFAQRQVTNRQRATFTKHLESVDISRLPEQWTTQLEEVKLKLAALEAHRLQVQRNLIKTPSESSAFFTELNDLILNLTGAIWMLAADPQLSRFLFGLSSYLGMKETIAQQRDTLSGQLALGAWAHPTVYNSFIRQNASKTVFLFNFRNSVDLRLLREHQSTVSGVELELISKWEEIATRYPSALSVSVGLPAKPSYWYWNCTSVIDKMQAVLVNSLQPEAIRRVSHASKDSKTVHDRSFGVVASALPILSLVVFLTAQLSRNNGGKVINNANTPNTPPQRQREEGVELKPSSNHIASSQPTSMMGASSPFADERSIIVRVATLYAKPLIVVLLVFHVVIVAYLLVTKVQAGEKDASALRSLELVVTTASIGSQLIHELQKERGSTALMIGSGFNTSKNAFNQFEPELRRQVELTDARIGAFTGALSAMSKLPGLDYSLLDSTREKIAGLPAHRRRVHNREFSTPAAATKYITSLDSSVVELVASFLTLPHDREMLQLMTALVNMMYSKEKAGLERAALSGAIAAGSFKTKLAYRFFVNSYALSGEYHRMYSSVVPARFGGLFSDLVRGPDVNRTRRWEQHALRLPKQLVPPKFPPLASYWFWNITTQIDQQLEVEVIIRDTLLQHTRHTTAVVAAAHVSSLLPYIGCLLVAAFFSVMIALSYRSQGRYKSSSVSAEYGIDKDDTRESRSQLHLFPHWRKRASAGLIAALMVAFLLVTAQLELFSPLVGSVSARVGSTSFAVSNHTELTGLVSIAETAAKFIHEIQRERGTTALLIGSGWSEPQQAHNDFTQDLSLQIQRTNDERVTLVAGLSGIDPRGKSSAWLQTIQRLEQKITLLDIHRIKVQQNVITTPIESNIYFQSLTRLVIKFVSGLSLMAADPELGRAIHGYASYIAMKETIDQQRAALHIQLILGSWQSPGHYNHYISLLSQERAQLFNFKLAMGEEFAALYSAGVQGLDVDRVALWQEKAAAFPPRLDSVSGLPTPVEWYGNSTTKLHYMRAVEKVLSAHLVRLVRSVAESSSSSIRAAQVLASVLCFLAACSVGTCYHTAKRSSSVYSVSGQTLYKPRLFFAWFSCLRVSIKFSVLIAVVGVCQLAIVAVAFTASLPSAQVTTMLRTIQPVISMAEAGSQLMHELQRERGTAALMVGSGFSSSAPHSFNQFQPEMYEQMKRTDLQIEAFTTTLVFLKKHSSVSQLVAATQQQIVGLQEHRRRVLSGSFPTAASTTAYITALDANIVELVASFIALPSGGRMQNLMIVLVNMMYSKELTGLERAALSGAIANGRFVSSSAYRFLVSSYTGRLAYQDLAVDIAPDHLRDVYSKTVRGADVERVKEWESKALTLPDQLVPPSFPALAGSFYWNITTQIDLQLVAEEEVRSAIHDDGQRIGAEVSTRIAASIVVLSASVTLLVGVTLLQLRVAVSGRVMPPAVPGACAALPAVSPQPRGQGNLEIIEEAS